MKRKFVEQTKPSTLSEVAKTVAEAQQQPVASVSDRTSENVGICLENAYFAALLHTLKSS